MKDDSVKMDYMELHDLFKRLEHLYRVRVKSILDPLQLTGLEYRFLKNIKENENLTISEISQRLGKHNSNTTNLLDNLEKKGYVERTNDTLDRRIIRIDYTEQGLINREEALSTFDSKVCQFLQDVPTPILVQSDQCMRYLIKKLEGDEKSSENSNEKRDV